MCVNSNFCFIATITPDIYSYFYYLVHSTIYKLLLLLFRMFCHLFTLICDVIFLSFALSYILSFTHLVSIYLSSYIYSIMYSAIYLVYIIFLNIISRNELISFYILPFVHWIAGDNSKSKCHIVVIFRGPTVQKHKAYYISTAYSLCARITATKLSLLDCLGGSHATIKPMGSPLQRLPFSTGYPEASQIIVDARGTNC